MRSAAWGGMPELKFAPYRTGCLGKAPSPLQNSLEAGGGRGTSVWLGEYLCIYQLTTGVHAVVLWRVADSLSRARPSTPTAVGRLGGSQPPVTHSFPGRKFWFLPPAGMEQEVCVGVPEERSPFLTSPGASKYYSHPQSKSMRMVSWA